MRCSALNCYNNTSNNAKNIHGVTFYKFPKKDPLRAAWLQALNIKNSTVQDHSYICSEHFRDADFYAAGAGCRKLKDAAVPMPPSSAEDLEAPAALLVCRICLATDINMFDVNDNNMNNFYTELIGIYIIDDRLPQKICWECAHRLNSCQKFKNKAKRSRDLLLSVLSSNQYLKLKDVRYINRTEHQLKSNLLQTAPEYTIDIKHNEHIKYEDKNNDIKFEDTITVDVKNEDNTSDVFINDFINDDGMPLTNHFDESDDDKLLIEIKGDKPKKIKKKKVKEKVVGKEKVKKKKVEDCLDEETDKLKIPEVKRRRKNEIDSNLFTVLPLSYEEQMKEIESRQESSSYKNAPFKCTFCYRGFNLKERYDTHAIRHSEQSGQYECFVCKTRLKSTRALRKHVTGQHTEQYICKGCPFSTRSRGVAREHEKWHSGTRYQCPHCPSQFDKLTTYMGHVRIKHASQFVCALCGFTFVSRKGVDVHVKKKHRLANVPLEGPYCSVCDVTFASQEAHDRHMKLSSKHCSEHDPERIRNDSQSIRPSSVRRRDRRDDLSRTSDDATEQIVTCEQCGIEFRGLRFYAQHFRRAHPDKNRTKYPAMKTPAMCELCGRIFQSMALLKDHMWVHTGVKRFQCSLCDKSFTQKTNLILHTKAHSDTRPSYPCHVCGKRFLFHNNRRRHMFIHTGLKPHSCSTCSKCFTTLGELKAHVAHVHLKKPWPRRGKHQKTSMTDAME